MFIKQMIKECDFTGRVYDTYVEGAGALAQGATGRMCVVLYAGPEYLAENQITIMTMDEAESWAAANDGWLDV